MRVSNTQHSYWDTPVPPERMADMASKYGCLLRIIELDESPARDRELRATAGRWPGSLREAQLISPGVLRARAAAAEFGASSASLTRGAWRQEGHEAVVLWADLHLLLEDQLAWRRAGRPESFGTWAQGLLARGEWPAPGAPEALHGGAVHARAAYRWLAARAGLDLPGLHKLLFERSGHWDRRDGD